MMFGLTLCPTLQTTSSAPEEIEAMSALLTEDGSTITDESDQPLEVE